MITVEIKDIRTSIVNEVMAEQFTTGQDLSRKYKIFGITVYKRHIILTDDIKFNQTQKTPGYK